MTDSMTVSVQPTCPGEHRSVSPHFRLNYCSASHVYISGTLTLKFTPAVGAKAAQGSEVCPATGNCSDKTLFFWLKSCRCRTRFTFSFHNLCQRSIWPVRSISFRRSPLSLQGLVGVDPKVKESQPRSLMALALQNSSGPANPHIF